MKKLDPQDLHEAVKILMQQAAKDRVELYALRILLYQVGNVGPIDFAASLAVAENRYEKLLAIVADNPQERPDLLEFLRAFEGPVQ